MSTDQAAPHSPRTWLVVLASTVVVVAVVTLATVHFVVRRAPDSLNGPTSQTMDGLRMNVGEVATWGSLFISNDGDSPLVLDDLTLNPDQETRQAQNPVQVQRLQVVPTSALTDSGAIGMVADSGDDVVPEGKRSPLAGYQLAPKAEVAVLIQYRARKEGAWKYDTVTVDYQQSGRSGHLTMQQAFSVCAPANDPCPTPDERGCSGRWRPLALPKQHDIAHAGHADAGTSVGIARNGWGTGQRTVMTASGNWRSVLVS